jgi:tetraacyldisaccharide 4'-kinase
MHWTEVWEGRSPVARVSRISLLPLSILYALGWESYRLVYRLGFKKPKAPHRPVVCVGNLVVGGAGKSPLVAYLARQLTSRGFQVVIGCSGYGSPRSEAATIAPEGFLKAKDWGDEPAMFRWQFPHLPIVVGRRRVLAAELVHERFPDSVLLMDDGFQHLPVHKDVNILLDAPRPTNGLCLPAGPYREPRWNRRRADLILPGAFEIESETLEIKNDSGALLPQGPYNLICALGQPGRFVRAATSALGSPPLQAVLLPDHDSLDGGTLLSDFDVATPIVVTAKDWVKLRERPDFGERSLYIAHHSVRISPEEPFFEWLTNRIHD